MPLPPLPDPWASEPTATIEQRVIGCCLFPLPGDDPHALVRQVMAALPDAAWSDPRHWEILQVLWALSQAGKPLDLVRVFTALRGRVPAAYVHDLWEAADTAQLLPQRLQELRRRWEEKHRPRPQE